MAEYDHLLALAKDAAQKAVKALAEVDTGSSSYKFADDLPREMKSTADRVLEEIILDCLKPTGLPILSEEAGDLDGTVNIGLRWVVDPLDGTVNFMRGLAPCAVSIALYSGDLPVFGVIGDYPSGKLAWGGRSFGAFIEGCPIHVSTIPDKSKAILCTGFPSRFDFAGASASAFIGLVSSYSKVRMLGAASLSLLQVAKGAADAYAEQDIMIWDVAAGLALIEGAGGHISVSPGRYKNSHNIYASNGLLIN
jgi:myo-inositol-1(or 4)-monophosphatase